MADFLDELTAFWKRHGDAPAAKIATSAQIEEWEQRYSVVLPADLRSYVTRVNGIFQGESLEFDHEGMSFLPLSAMCAETEWTESGARPNMFVFADFLIRSHWWCAALDEKPHEHTRIFLGGCGTKNHLVASSLAEFIDLYMNDHGCIYPR
jgi:hypothetical protein